MKRIFTNLKAYASAALAVAVMGVATLGVSCKYDDTAIYDEIENVKGDLSALEERVTKLEQKLNTEITGLQALIVTEKQNILDELNGKIESLEGAGKEMAAQLAALQEAVGKVITAEQKANGSWVLTLADGKQITVYPEAKQTYHGITVAQQNGVYYWAEYKADGTIVFLTDENGQKYPLHQPTAEVELPESIQQAVQVKFEDGVNKVSFDGGQSWYALGGGDAGLFDNVAVNEDGTVTFTIAGGEQFTVELAKEAEPELVFGIKSGKLYLANEETKVVKLAVENVKDCTVLVQPRGWTIEVNGDKLSVTAPSYIDVVDAMTADEEGDIKILATDGTGKAIVAKLRVSTAENGLFLNVNVADATFDIINTLTYEEMGESQAMYYYYGISDAETFDIDALKLAAENYELRAGQDNVSYEGLGIAECYSMLNEYYDYETFEWVSPEMVAGGKYIIWAAPMSMETYTADFDEIVFVEYLYASASCEVLSTTFADAIVKLEVLGYDGYRINLYQDIYAEGAKEEFESWTSGNSWWPWGELMENEGFEGSVFETLYTDSAPATKYHLYILPISNDKAATDYLWSDVIDIEFETKAITAGGTGAPTMALNEESTSYTSIVATLTPTEDALRTYYFFYTAEELAAFANDDAVIADLLANGYIIAEESEVRQNGVSAGSSRTLAAVSVDAEGKYGQLAKAEYTSKAVSYSDVTVSFDATELSADALSYSVKISTSGEVVKYRYEIIEKSASSRWGWTYKQDLASVESAFAIATDNDYYIKTVAAEDLLNEFGYATFDLKGYDKTFILAVAAIDADGNCGKITTVEFTSTFSATVIPQFNEDGSENEKWAASKPTVNYTTAQDPDVASWTILTVTVTPGSGATMCWMGKFYVSSELLPSQKVKNMLSNWATGGRDTLADAGAYGVGSFVTESDTVEYTMTPGYHLHISWTDAEGNFYEPMCLTFDSNDEPEIA